MAIRGKIQAGVDKAFLKIADMLKDVTFTYTEPTSFSFDDNTAALTPVTYATKGFPYSKASKVDGQVVTTQLLMIKTKDWNFSGYTTVSVEGVTYTCSEMSKDDFIIIFKLVRS